MVAFTFQAANNRMHSNKQGRAAVTFDKCNPKNYNIKEEGKIKKINYPKAYKQIK